MMSQWFKVEDWAQFRQQFPHAHSWFVQRELERELEFLLDWEAKGFLSPWQINRLADLRHWKQVTDEINNAHDREF